MPTDKPEHATPRAVAGTAALLAVAAATVAVLQFDLFGFGQLDRNTRRLAESVVVLAVGAGAGGLLWWLAKPRRTAGPAGFFISAGANPLLASELSQTLVCWRSSAGLLQLARFDREPGRVTAEAMIPPADLLGFELHDGAGKFGEYWREGHGPGGQRFDGRCALVLWTRDPAWSGFEVVLSRPGPGRRESEPVPLNLLVDWGARLRLLMDRPAPAG